MAYNWTNGEVITADKLNATGGSGIAYYKFTAQEAMADTNTVINTIIETLEAHGIVEFDNGDGVTRRLVAYTITDSNNVSFEFVFFERFNSNNYLDLYRIGLNNGTPFVGGGRVQLTSF